jgi:hypothetical protein
VLALIGGRTVAPGRAGPGSQQQTVLQSFPRGELRFLFDERNAQPVASLQLPVIERDLACEHTEQCRLTGTVAADEPEALADLNGELRFIKERMLAEGDMCIEKCDQGHGRIVGTGGAMGKVREIARRSRRHWARPRS